MTVERKVDENGAITEIITLTEEEKSCCQHSARNCFRAL